LTSLIPDYPTSKEEVEAKLQKAFHNIPIEEIYSYSTKKIVSTIYSIKV